MDKLPYSHIHMNIFNSQHMSRDKVKTSTFSMEDNMALPCYHCTGGRLELLNSCNYDNQKVIQRPSI